MDKNKPESGNSVEAFTCQENGNKKQGLLATLKRYPKGVFFCFGNEFAERFSFYGMTAILTLYLKNEHKMTESMAALIFHVFHFVACFSPMFGSIIADGFFGRYRVIVYISIFYCFGHLMITLGAIESIDSTARKSLDLTGLFVVGLATGGITPCVISFAADQFPSTMLKERGQFFSLFYFSVNLGALLSMILTPIFRTQFSYALAFGVPAIFMGIALAIFLCGRPFYKIVECKENVVWNVIKCVLHALRKTIKNRGAPTSGHFLDHSVPIFGQQLVDDVKTIFNIMLLYVPVIFFWALYDQQGSTWVLQANRMDGRLGRLTIIPEQMSFLNPLLIILLIPLCVKFIYPFFTKRNILVGSLERMTCGLIMAAISFLIAGFIQIKINATLVPPPQDGLVKYTFVNLANCQILVDDYQLKVDEIFTADISSPKENRTIPNLNYEKNCLRKGF